MTPEQIKSTAKQAGGTTHTTNINAITFFLDDGLTEFVRLVRQQAFEEATNALVEFGENLRHASAGNEVDIALTCAYMVKGMK